MTDLAGRSTFMQVPKIRYLEVEVEDFGTVRIRSFTAEQMGEFQAMKKREDSDAWLVWMGCVDENGNRIWRDDDLPTVRALDAGLVSQIARAIIVHCTNFGDLEKKYGSLDVNGLIESQEAAA